MIAFGGQVSKVVGPKKAKKRVVAKRKKPARKHVSQKARIRAAKGLEKFTMKAHVQALIDEFALVQFHALVEGGMGVCEAYDRVSAELTFDHRMSPRKLRRLRDRAAKRGARALYHRRHKRCGRKPKYQSVTE